MAVSLTRFSWRLWGGKEKEPVSNGSSPNSSFEWGFGLREPETVKFPTVKGTKISSSQRKVKRKWQSREERKIDREFDAELVPSDGVCLSGSESDDPDWSIGWFEPHGPDFESDDGLAVLVPSYRPGCKKVVESSDNQLLSAITNLTNEFSPGKSYSFCIWFYLLPLFLLFCCVCTLYEALILNPSPILKRTLPLILNLKFQLHQKTRVHVQGAVRCFRLQLAR
jgi:hypothetical protein